MNPQETLDALKHLSQIHREQFNERRKSEWKVLIATLSFYVLSVVAKYSGENHIPTCDEFVWSVRAIFVFIAIMTISYLAHIHLANHKNKSFAKNAEDEIYSLLQTGNITKINIFSFTSCWANWSWARQSIAILFFAIAPCTLFSNIEPVHCT